ncbi:ADP-ribosylation factor-like protein 3 [Cotesia glomerata]|uniref:ADP-ribosylation factor-like protein 3 n=1 Tax=Cotesia glomerata TaxID=32391 RepID=A0AAV7IMQ6_COTGL|nr:ADP-ribosylation factor-like protein 3 [Cotesia glomerata]KAH0554933.1 hypothetical protein KQX54_013954 [Cotesia glomerata]
MFRTSKKIIIFGCACASAYVFYYYWKKRQLKSIDEGFEEVAKIDDSNERRVLLLGLNNAGKSSVMNQIVSIEDKDNVYSVPPKKTDGFAVYLLKNKDFICNVWEIGGSDEVRKHWNNFLQDTDVLIFMVDASDANQLSQAVLSLKEILGDSRMDNVPILVIANKQDVPDALKADQIKRALDLHSISPHKHKVEVITCQTMPIPDSAKKPGTSEYSYCHPSMMNVRKKIFSLASAT